jgi:hypothetical protein
MNRRTFNWNDPEDVKRLVVDLHVTLDDTDVW